MSDQQLSSQLSFQNNDELDLVEIFRILWVKKLWIILITFIFTAIAAVYAFTAKEQWTSKAEIAAPRTIDLGDYLSIRKEYGRIVGSGVDIAALSGSLFGKFNRLAYSLDEKEEFLSKSDFYKYLIQDEDKEKQRKILSELAREKLLLEKPDPKKDINIIGNMLNFSAETPEFSQNTLRGYIEFINEKVFAEEISTFLVGFNNTIADLLFEKNKIEQDLGISKDVRLINLNQAYETAKKAGVKEYSRLLKEGSDIAIANIASGDTKIPLSESKLGDSTYLFMLGEKYLKAQIDIENEMGIKYPTRYYQIKTQLKQLEPLLEKIKNVKAKSYSYISSPDYPVVKDYPKVILILLLGCVLGIFFSFISISIIYVIKRR